MTYNKRCLLLSTITFLVIHFNQTLAVTKARQRTANITLEFFDDSLFNRNSFLKSLKVDQNTDQIENTYDSKELEFDEDVEENADHFSAKLSSLLKSFGM